MIRLLDTSAIYAWTSASDPNHTRARATLREPGLRLATTNIVAGESFTLIRQRSNYETATSVLDALHSMSIVSIVMVDDAFHERIRSKLREFAGIKLSYADASLLVLGDLQGIASVFSFDSDFRMAGLTLVP